MEYKHYPRITDEHHRIGSVEILFSLHTNTAKAIRVKVFPKKAKRAGRPNVENPIPVKDYPLILVTHDQMMEHRLSGIPGAAYRKDNKLYYAELPPDLISHGMNHSLGVHLCGNNCSNCGSCPRTRALTVDFQIRTLGKQRDKAVLDSWRIESPDMSIVQEGLEFFNMRIDSFHVIRCSDYAVPEPAPVLTKKDAKAQANRITQHKMYLFSAATGKVPNSAKEMLRDMKALGLPGKYDGLFKE